jgi:hypothetical protein
MNEPAATRAVQLVRIGSKSNITPAMSARAKKLSRNPKNRWRRKIGSARISVRYIRSRSLRCCHANAARAVAARTRNRTDSTTVGVPSATPPTVRISAASTGSATR